ncbi:RsmG family class I SAM-dependent methyltransferase, partial [Haemophilus parainfluenzae]|uniref:RsmG family class I SAM-dependent methyltransferase n=1 Tax=Haemophilus parainfluenzae TaxID=729 RepID=UPI00157EAAEC
THVAVLAERSEVVAQQPAYRETFDLALVRAVGSASTCAEYGLPLLRLGGKAILYRGQWTTAEAEELNRAIAQLGGAISAVRAVT